MLMFDLKSGSTGKQCAATATNCSYIAPYDQNGQNLSIGIEEQISIDGICKNVQTELGLS